MTLSQRIAEHRTAPPPTCPDPYKVGCVRPAGEHICSGPGGNLGFRDPGLPVWRRRVLEGLTNLSRDESWRVS